MILRNGYWVLVKVSMAHNHRSDQFLYFIELVLVLNIAVILRTERKSINQSINQSTMIIKNYLKMTLIK
jgi:hypothetical protein